MILCLKAHLYNWVYKAHENEFLERISSSFQKNLMISCVTIQIPNSGSERRIRKKLVKKNLKIWIIKKFGGGKNNKFDDQ